MATKKDILPSILNKIRTTFSNSINDNQGWVRGGKFTPVQQIKDIQSASPIGAFGLPNLKNQQVQQNFKTGANNLQQWGNIAKQGISNQIDIQKRDFNQYVVNPLFNQTGQNLGRGTFGGEFLNTAKKPVIESLANIGAVGANTLGNIQMALNKPSAALNSYEKALAARRFAGTEGSFDQGFKSGGKTLLKGGASALQTYLMGKGLPKMTAGNVLSTMAIGGGISKANGGSFMTGAGQATGVLPQVLGFSALTNPQIAKLLPDKTGIIAQRGLPALGNAVQGVGMDLAMGNKTSIGSVVLDLLTGAIGGKAGFDVPNVKGMTNEVWTRDKSIVNNVRQLFATKISPGETLEAEKILKEFEKPYGLNSHTGYNKMNLSQKYDLLNDIMNEMASQWANIKMGITDQPIKTGTKYSFANTNYGIQKNTDGNFYVKEDRIGNSTKTLLEQKIPDDLGKEYQDLLNQKDALNGSGLSTEATNKRMDIQNKLGDLTDRIIRKLGLEDLGIVISKDGKIIRNNIEGEANKLAEELYKIGKLTPELTKQFQENPKQFLLDNSPSNLSPESVSPIKTGGEAILDRKVDLGFTPQKDIVPQTGKIKTTLSETGVIEPTTKGSEISQLSISKKGKLNTDKLNITPEQKVAIDQIQDNVPVTVIGNKDVIEQSKLTTGRKAQLSDEEMKVRLAQQLNSRQEVVSLQRQYDKLKQSGASELELIAQKQKIIDQSRVAQQQGTFAGRLLQSQNILANEMATPEQKIYAMLDVAGVDSKKYLKDAINVDFNNGTQVVNFYRKYVPAKFGEILDEIRYTNMLSSPLTQIVNTFSNVIQAGIVKPIEKTITGQLDWISSKFTGRERQYFASQGIDYSKGVWKSLPEAFTKFKNIVSGKEISIKPDMFNSNNKIGLPTSTKGSLKWYTTPLRMLEASDQFFRTLVQSGERKSLSKLNLPEAEIAKRAAQSADYTLFRQKFDPTGELGQGVVLKTWDKWNSAVQNLRKVPGGNWILPFIQTPTNILKQGFEYSPLGVSTMIGSKRPLEQLSKAIIGSSAFLSLYGLADKGGTTWDVPSNEKDKELFYAAGLQPYSVKIGDKWVSYSKLGPLSYPMAMASALKWVEKNNPDQNVIENLQGALGEMLSFFGDQSYVSSIGDFINTMKSGYGVKNAVSGEVTNLISQLIPYKSFQGWLTRMIDPTYRKPDGMLETIQSQTPGLSTGVPAYQDIYGQDSKRDLPVFNSFSPLKVSTEKPTEKSMYESQEQYRIGLSENNKLKKEFEKTGKVSGTTGGTKTAPYFYTDDTGQVKEVKIDKYTSMPEQTAYQKALKEKQKYTLVDDIMDNLTGDQQIEALQTLGISAEDATYYNTAKQENYLKSIYVEEEIMGMLQNGQNKDQILNTLANMRKAVNEKVLLADGVITDLVDKNIISYEDGKMLKNIDKDLKPKALKAKKAKKLSLSGKKFTASKKAYNPLKVKSTTTKSRFTPPKYVKADLRTSFKLL